jgi:SET domain
LFAAQDVEPEEILITYDGPIIDHPTRLSIQIDDDKHIEGTEDSNACLNHSCEPNAYVDWDDVCLRARSAIPAGVEITCDYFTTDYEIHSPFPCSCGSARCKGEVRGFKYLTAAERLEREPWLPPFLKRKPP